MGGDNMPNLNNSSLVSNLTNRVRGELNRADRDGDGHVSRGERASLPSDVRGLADNTADAYLGGGDLPIGAFVDAYRNFASSAVSGADRDGSGSLSDGEQARLPQAVFASVTALRAGSANTGRDLDDMIRTMGRDGWTDDELNELINEAQKQGKVNQYSGEIWAAALNPKTAGAASHTGGRFYEALAWYTDKTLAGSNDGFISLSEIGRAKQAKAQEYFQLFGDPSKADQRRQTHKFIQKLALLENEIRANGDTGYRYDAAAMGSINHNSAWNAANTIDSRAEFQRDVIQASFNKPVMVKYGLTYCVHCLLLEQLDSVRAVDDAHPGLDVKKVWWNPHDPALAEVTQLAQDEGVTSSPFFIVYDQGQPVRAGYAFPDESGGGMDALLNGVI
jgi:hypothetical protein